MSEQTVTVREVLRLLLEADSYPCLGNEDWAIAAGMEALALENAKNAVASADDPPQFGQWLEALQREDLPVNECEEIYWALHEYFLQVVARGRR